MGNNINGVRERLERACIDEHGITWLTAKVDGGDLRTLLADHARLAEELRKVNAGETVSVRFDLSPAAKEGAVRDQLVAMGWTPPGHLETTAPEGAACPAVDLEQFREAVEALHAANIAQELARAPGYPSIQFQRTAQKCIDLMALIDGQASSQPNDAAQPSKGDGVSDLSGYLSAASQVRRGYDVECSHCGGFCDDGQGPCEQPSKGEGVDDGR